MWPIWHHSWYAESRWWRTLLAEVVFSNDEVPVHWISSSWMSIRTRVKPLTMVTTMVWVQGRVWCGCWCIRTAVCPLRFFFAGNGDGFAWVLHWRAMGLLPDPGLQCWSWCIQEIRQVSLCCLLQWCQLQPHWVLAVQQVQQHHLSTVGSPKLSLPKMYWQGFARRWQKSEPRLMWRTISATWALVGFATVPFPPDVVSPGESSGNAGLSSPPSMSHLRCAARYTLLASTRLGPMIVTLLLGTGFWTMHASPVRFGPPVYSTTRFQVSTNVFKTSVTSSRRRLFSFDQANWMQEALSAGAPVMLANATTAVITLTLKYNWNWLAAGRTLNLQVWMCGGNLCFYMRNVSSEVAYCQIWHTPCQGWLSHYWLCC